MFRSLTHIWRSLRYLRHYVVADSRDNSITFSHALFRHISKRVNGSEDAKVIVFRVPECGCYGFMVNPRLSQETQLADIQYNGKFRSIGFESLCPTVVRIFTDYGLQPFMNTVCLSVLPSRTADGILYYQILPPRK